MSSAIEDIAASRQRYMEGMKNGDVDAILSVHTDDAVWMPLNEPSIYGSAELKEWYEDYFAHFRMISFTETERDVMVMNDWALERCSYMVVIQPVQPGERIRDDGRCLALWKRDADGVWRIAQSMINSIRPVGSGTSRFLVRMQARGQT